MRHYLRSRYPRPVFAGAAAVPSDAVAVAAHQEMECRTTHPARSRINPVLCWMFYAFVFSMGIETIDIGLRGQNVYLSKIVGYLFVGTTLLQPRVCFRRPPMVFWFFTVYVCVYAMLGALQNVENHPAIFGRLFTLVQMLILFWVGYNLMRHERVARGALLTLAASCLVLSALELSGMASAAGDDGKRPSALGQDPNWLASTISLGVLALVGLTYRRDRSRIQGRLLVWPLCALLGISIVFTGSRGGFLALAAGLLAFLLRQGSMGSRFRMALVALLAIGSLIWVSSQWDATRTRWQDALDAGDMAGRERIFPTAWQMFRERPLVGWGPMNHCYELGSRLHHYEPVSKTGLPYREAHNLILWILIESGLVGAIPFFAAVWLCVRAAWRARAGPHGGLPLAMTMTLLVANLSTTQIYLKLHWLVLAYAVASGTHFVQTRSRRSVARLARPAVRHPAVRSL